MRATWGSGEDMELSWPLGTDLLQFDADTMALGHIAETLAMHFADCMPLTRIFILSANASALQAIKNPWIKSCQEAALCFHQSLTTIVTRWSHVKFSLVWTPRDTDSTPQEHCTQLAHWAAREPGPEADHRIQLALFQKAHA